MNKLYRAPCKDCPDRYIGCHANCDAYISYCVKMRNYRKHTDVVGDTIAEGKKRFWNDVRKRGLKI